MRKVMFHYDDKFGIFDAFDISNRPISGAIPIPAEECRQFNNSLGIKCLGLNSEGYIEYGK